MSPSTILKRIRGLFASDAREHLDCIDDPFAGGRLKEPLRPMSDQELACAIREFRSASASDWSLAKLAQRFAETSVPREG